MPLPWSVPAWTTGPTRAAFPMYVDLSGLAVTLGRWSPGPAPVAAAPRVTGAGSAPAATSHDALLATLDHAGVHVAASRNPPLQYDDALRQAREAARRALAAARDAEPAWLPGTRFVAGSGGLRYMVEPPNPAFALRLVVSTDGGQTWTALASDAGAEGEQLRADLAGRTLQFGIFDGDGAPPPAGAGTVDLHDVQVAQVTLGADGGWSLAFEDPPGEADRGDDDAVLNLFDVALAAAR